MVQEMTAREFIDRRAAGAELTLVDVREDWETELAPVPTELIHIPIGQIAERLAELDPHRETVVICRSGGRSLQVAHFLAAQGFEPVYNLSGGILAWSRDIDPRIPQY
ncbi:MAG: rhodanese-like domain-containing protein [Steroidobacteraceae bacterium]